MEEGIQEKGIKETKELISLLAVLPKIGTQAMEDGKIGVSDLGLLFELLPVLEPAVDKVGAVPGEVLDLTDVEREELTLHIAEKVQIASRPELERIVELAASAALKFAQIAKLYKDMNATA